MALGVLLFKFKTVLSMLFSIWLYSYRWGWPFAIGFVLLIFVHEMGHVIAAKWLGIPVSAPLFIPFVGAAIAMKNNPRDAWSEALMAYGGPLAGGAGALAVWGVALQQQSPFLMALASTGFGLNLFNLIPVPPLDGGRICAAISPWFWIIGLALLGTALFFLHLGTMAVVIIVLVVYLALPRLRQVFFQRNSPAMQAYYGTGLSNRLTMALMYVGLILALLLGLWDATQHLHSYQELGLQGV